MAPPRLVGELGFVDTVTLHSEAYRVLQPPSLTNQFAAIPSLHVGWNLLMGIAIVSFSTNRLLKVFGVSMPIAMYVATIVTANHYFLDGVLGSALALIGLGVAWKISRPRQPVWTMTRRTYAPAIQ
jgi:membrane-associated phospholipid phosphatase